MIEVRKGVAGMQWMAGKSVQGALPEPKGVTWRHGEYDYGHQQGISISCMGLKHGARYGGVRRPGMDNTVKRLLIMWFWRKLGAI